MWESTLIPSSSSQVVLLNRVHLSPSGSHLSLTHRAVSVQLPWAREMRGELSNNGNLMATEGYEMKKGRKVPREEGESSQTKTLRDSK